ncbi:1-phosphofructokinase family hexose kinase [Nesterenkonia sp. NBAIMH1]|uniref:1-phosphofructokinase family hexose kinase n=1 Tax=Nesterenkonia sp. NBAIMH1 TaxID=2600320 RepID=UPI0011B50D45|nr:1-phosphofructokinase family hexose kinase [Nesterenkonia sp. NBAIMH1]
MQAPILTLTMNPALDVSSSVDRVRGERKLRCGPARFDPGGGGVNVSRAIRSLGGSSTAVYPLGGPTGDAYSRFVADSGIAGHVVTIAGDTRQSLTVDETSTGEQYRFVLPGPVLSEAEWKACLSAAADRLSPGGFLVASGSLPPGVPEDLYATLAGIAQARGVRLAVDASGPPLEAALSHGVFLIKPSRDELADLVGADRDLSPDEQLHAARRLVAEGRAEAVALTLGSEGALLVTSHAALRLPTPRVTVASTVGAGDAFLAGMVLRLAEGIPLPRAFRTAVAAGSAAAMMPGTGVCRAEDVARLAHELAPTEGPRSLSPARLGADDGNLTAETHKERS